MSIQVTRRQVAAAKLRLALDEAAGRTSDEWAVRVANAAAAEPPTTRVSAHTEDIAGQRDIIPEHGGRDALVQRLMNAVVVDNDGDTIGSVGQVFLDDQSGEPSWVAVRTGVSGAKEALVPLHQASDIAGDELRVRYSKDVVRGAPAVEADQGRPESPYPVHHITPEEEQELHSYYEGYGWMQKDWTQRVEVVTLRSADGRDGALGEERAGHRH